MQIFSKSLSEFEPTPRACPQPWQEQQALLSPGPEGTAHIPTFPGEPFLLPPGFISLHSLSPAPEFFTPLVNYCKLPFLGKRATNKVCSPCSCKAHPECQGRATAVISYLNTCGFSGAAYAWSDVSSKSISHVFSCRYECWACCSAANQ